MFLGPDGPLLRPRGSEIASMLTLIFGSREATWTLVWNRFLTSVSRVATVVVSPARSAGKRSARSAFHSAEGDVLAAGWTAFASSRKRDRIDVDFDFW